MKKSSLVVLVALVVVAVVPQTLGAGVGIKGGYSWSKFAASNPPPAASAYLSNVVGLIIVLSTVPLFAAILRIPFAIIAPVIVVVCAIGAFTVNNAMFNIWVMLAFGIIGYVFKKLDYPLAPMILAWSSFCPPYRCSRRFFASRSPSSPRSSW